MNSEENQMFSITKEFLEKILQKKVHQFLISPALKPGENNLSDVLSIEVLNSNSQSCSPIYLIMKSFPKNVANWPLLYKINCFWKEFTMYTELIPKLASLPRRLQIKSTNVDDLKLPFPEFVFGEAIDYLNIDEKSKSTESKNIIVMVDVCKMYGFSMPSKYTGFDYFHCAIVMKELAKFHAFGWSYRNHTEKKEPLRHNYPTIRSYFATAPSSETRATLLPYWEMGCKNVLQMLQSSDKVDLVNAFKNIPKNLAEMYIASRISSPISESDYESLLRVNPWEGEEAFEDQWTVLTHSDLWTNNCLFKYDQCGKPEKVIFVDLQMCTECCPMTELVYFFYTSTESPLRKESLNQLLLIYYNYFVDFCSTLKSPPLPRFSIENFQRRFHRSKILGLVNAILTLPGIFKVMDSSDGDPYPNNSEILKSRLIGVVQDLYDDSVL